MKPLACCLPVLLLALGAAPAAADGIYKCVDEQGRATYTNVKRSGARDCKPLEADISVVPTGKPKAAAAPAKAPEDFPRVDNDTQKRRDEARRRILEDELATEQKLLAEARQALTEGEATRQGNERNYQKYLDRVNPLKENVALHERNVQALQKELANLK